MNPELREEIDELINNYLGDELLISLIENWSTVGERPPESRRAIKNIILGQIFGATMRLYCQSRKIKESQIDDKGLQDLTKVFDERYQNIVNKVDSIIGRYHAY